jgi:H+-transporting ATPase
MAAIVDRVTAQPSIPEATVYAGIASRVAPEHASLGSATAESKRLETHSSLPGNSPDFENVVSKAGLTSDEARRRLARSGPNAMPDTSPHPIRMALDKFWAPVPWMLEAAIVVELALGKYVEAGIIALLLVFNAALGLFQESRAQATLAALKSRLALSASVQRDGVWRTVPATELAVGDVVKLSLGAVVAADVKLTGGEVLLDQSMLTGESIPIEAGVGVQTYAGALVRRGEAEAEVTATGARTKFGRTAELVRTAHVVSTQQTAVLRVVRNLAAFNGAVIVLLVTYAWYIKMPVTDIIPLVLTANTSCAHRDPGLDTRRVAGHLHPRVGARRAGSRKAGCASHSPLRSR